MYKELFRKLAQRVDALTGIEASHIVLVANQSDKKQLNFFASYNTL